MAVATEKGVKILVADDENAVRASVAFVLKQAGHTVQTVSNGENALTKLSKSPGEYKILMTDHYMEKMTGLELLQRLRKIGFRGRIVVLSGYLNHDLEATYLALGADRIIRKPFDLVELRRTIEDLRPEREEE